MLFLLKKIDLLFIVFVVIVVDTLLTTGTLHQQSKRNPVVLLPGDGGCQLRASLNKSEVPHFYCKEHTSEYSIWLDVGEFVPPFVNCFIENIRLVYDNTTRTSSFPPGVNITVPGFGPTSTVEWLDPSHESFTKYYVGLVNALVAKGYVRNTTVRGAPYDFRRAPNEAAQYFKDLKALIEETYYMNGNTKVVMISHSLGCMFGLYFLNHQDQDWKDKFIQSWVPIAPPLGGATKIIRLYASGDDFGVWAVEALKARKAQRTYPSSALLAPLQRLWAKDEAIVITPKRNYTAYDYQVFFNDVGYETGYELWKDTSPLNNEVKAPGVPVFSIHGKDVPTEEQYTYGDEFPDVQPKIKFGQGDGTVNMRSLKALLKWKNEQKQPVIEYEISGGEHLAILQNSTLHDYIINKVLQLNST
ncbi:group XV phospholipase A2-like [Anneissia japonica]|uniref:group XV phospholipase A2-like n=1 Tax=Anneissia japonica TaxID=1529436 RepID=UPI001425BB79|nr:group XV phospholipase A2-like [Anneissia japonica]